MAEWVACVIAARALCGTLVVLLGGLLVHVAQVRTCAAGRAQEGLAGVVCGSLLLVPRCQHLGRQGSMHAKKAGRQAGRHAHAVRLRR